MLSLCLILGALSAAAADEPPEYEYRSTFGPDGREESSFAAPGSVAVDQGTGSVYVIDRETGTLYKFDDEGQPVDFGGSAGYISGNAINGLNLYSGANESQVAVDPATHIIYVTTSDDVIRAFQASGEPAEFTAGLGAGTSSLPVGGELLGVAVDSTGDIYASDYYGPVKVYASSGSLIAEFETEKPASLAVAPDGDLYVSEYSGPVRRFTPSEFPVTSATTYTPDLQPFEEDPSLAVAVDPATSYVFVAERRKEAFQTGRLRVYSPSGTLLTTIGEAEFARRLGVAVLGSSGRIFVSTNFSDLTSSFSDSKVEIYAPKAIFVGAPTVVSTSVSKVTADTATLAAQINPNTLETTYRFEYGTADCATSSSSSCTVVPAGDAQAGSGRKPVIVSQPISALEPDTTYHYRVVAKNSNGTTFGPDQTFVTQVSGLGFELSDSRAWEMVSPSLKFGGTVVASSAGITQAAENGSGIAYLTIGSLEREPDGSRAIEPASVLTRRGSDGIWESKDITVPHDSATGFLAAGSEYDIFDRNLNQALLEPRDSTPLSDRASERSPYIRENTSPPAYAPLVTGKEGSANVPPGTVFDRPGQVGAVAVRGADKELTHVVLESKVPLVAGAPPVGAGVQLYEWVAGKLLPVGVLPSEEGGGTVEGVLGSEQGTVRHAISEDGTRVFWSPGSIGTGSSNFTGVYVRDPIAAESGRLDVVEEGTDGDGTVSPMFQGASADGTVVYFTDTRQLTDDASPSGRDLYRCELPMDEVATGCQSLIDLSAPSPGSEESAKVQGLAPGLSEDGSRIYFVAEGDLGAGAGTNGEGAVAGEPNLYLWSEGEDLRFIATLSDEDDRDWGRVNGQTPGYEANLVADASPSGRYLAFMSQRGLTGAANTDASTGQAVEQVFVYDAQAESLTCASCDPTGASPMGELSPPHAVDLHSLWTDRPIGASLPEAAVSAGPQAGHYPVYRPRAVHDNGRVLFNAVGGLVPADSNGEWDVYQYEPSGVGGCGPTSADAATTRSKDACLSLISSGVGEGDSVLVDASVSGDDVFFLTRGRLSVLDKDTVNDIYDARVHGIPAVLSPVSECAGETCQHPSEPPNPPVSASEAFHGTGPALACPKGKRKVHRHGKVRCVRRHTHRKHRGHKKHQHQRSDHNGGTTR